MSETEMSCLATYLHALDGYTENQLHYKSQEDVWSLGQMYDHILLVAHEYLDEVDHCAALQTGTSAGKTAFGEQLFLNDAFPPIKIRLPDAMNGPPNNTDPINRLRIRLVELMERMEDQPVRISQLDPSLKTAHPGFGWLNAEEWYRLIDMHNRHHLRQKKELESAFVQRDS